MKQFISKACILIIAFLAFSFTANKTTGNKMIACYIIELEGNNEVPQVNTDARGIAVIRVMSDRQLHTRVIVHRLDAVKDGTLTSANIYAGAAGSNGPLLVTIAAGAGDFDQNIAQWLTASQYATLLNDAIYVNVHSTAYASGLIRGQLR